MCSISKRLFCSALLLVTSASSPTWAQTIVTDGNGGIARIENFTVNGEAWNVTLSGEYNGATYSQSFALAASDALLEYFDTELEGTLFDDDPQRAVGCSSSIACEWNTVIETVPDGAGGAALVSFATFRNFSPGGPFPDDVVLRTPATPEPPSDSVFTTYLTWAPHDANPIGSELRFVSNIEQALVNSGAVAEGQNALSLDPQVSASFYSQMSGSADLTTGTVGSVAMATTPENPLSNSSNSVMHDVVRFTSLFPQTVTFELDVELGIGAEAVDDAARLIAETRIYDIAGFDRWLLQIPASPTLDLIIVRFNETVARVLAEVNMDEQRRNDDTTGNVDELDPLNFPRDGSTNSYSTTLMGSFEAEPGKDYAIRVRALAASSMRGFVDASEGVTFRFVGLDQGDFVSESGVFLSQSVVDSDGDGVADSEDNCLVASNADQRDTDADGYGNLCDADLNNDCIVNVIDLGILRTVFFSGDPDADFNGDGVVNVQDLGILRTGFFALPGPSATASCP